MKRPKPKFQKPGIIGEFIFLNLQCFIARIYDAKEVWYSHGQLNWDNPSYNTPTVSTYGAEGWGILALGEVGGDYTRVLSILVAFCLCEIISNYNLNLMWWSGVCSKIPLILMGLISRSDFFGRLDVCIKVICSICMWTCSYEHFSYLINQ